MGDTELFALFWKCAATVVCVLILTAGGCTAHQNRLQAEVIAKAPNPALMQCSFNDGDRKSSAFCVEVARQK
ncbi:exported hypothetical protein [Cupriavidus phytorum]|uniref:Lipoprotein n=1 Tax=Cupriavidus taiwanensis TaxID=164546 RepID=A0A375C8Z5_9BURK|nr:hypothetical protein [Cupriavidus taiwanensis]SOY65608.1 exported hypothetical protein [Cupriavidus taiwanensis]